MTNENLDPDRISSTAIERGGEPTVPVGRDPFTRDPIIDQKLGWVGKFFGYGEEKKGNITGMAFVFSACMLIFCLCGQLLTQDQEVQARLAGFVTPLFGLLTGLLGYSEGRKNDTSE